MSDYTGMFQSNTETAAPAYRIPNQPTEEPPIPAPPPAPPVTTAPPAPPAAPTGPRKRQQRLPLILGAAGLAFIAVVVVAALVGNKPAKQAAPIEIRIGQNCNEPGRSAVTLAGTLVRCTNGTWQAIEPVPPPAAAVPEPPSPAAETPPKPADFKLTVKILRKQCFGSAGCNISFRIDVAYDGPTFTGSYLITYEVRGGEDGPLVNSFTIEGETAQVESEETVGTKSSKSKLTARVTDVAEN